MIWCIKHEDEIMGGGDGPLNDSNTDEEMMETGPVTFVDKAKMVDTTERIIKSLDHQRNRLFF